MNSTSDFREENPSENYSVSLRYCLLIEWAYVFIHNSISELYLKSARMQLHPENQFDTSMQMRFGRQIPSASLLKMYGQQLLQPGISLEPTASFVAEENAEKALEQIYHNETIQSVEYQFISAVIGAGKFGKLSGLLSLLKLIVLKEMVLLRHIYESSKNSSHGHITAEMRQAIADINSDKIQQFQDLSALFLTYDNRYGKLLLKAQTEPGNAYHWIEQLESEIFLRIS